MQNECTMESMRDKPSIVAVDDEPMMLRYLIGMLGDQYRIHVFTEGESALLFMRREMPDLILLDLYMPGMDGATLYTCIRSQTGYQDVPILFLTGNRNAQATLQQRLDERVLCIYKPVPKYDLLSEIAAGLNRSKQRA